VGDARPALTGVAALAGVDGAAELEAGAGEAGVAGGAEATLGEEVTGAAGVETTSRGVGFRQ
jgi:hypothetical protein